MASAAADRDKERAARDRAATPTAGEPCASQHPAAVDAAPASTSAPAMCAAGVVSGRCGGWVLLRPPSADADVGAGAGNAGGGAAGGASSSPFLFPGGVRAPDSSLVCRGVAAPIYKPEWSVPEVTTLAVLPGMDKYFARAKKMADGVAAEVSELSLWGMWSPPLSGARVLRPFFSFHACDPRPAQNEAWQFKTIGRRPGTSSSSARGGRRVASARASGSLLNATAPAAVHLIASAAVDAATADSEALAGGAAGRAHNLI